jgi:hypothetical protein
MCLCGVRVCHSSLLTSTQTSEIVSLCGRRLASQQDVLGTMALFLHACDAPSIMQHDTRLFVFSLCCFSPAPCVPSVCAACSSAAAVVLRPRAQQGIKGMEQK